MNPDEVRKLRDAAKPGPWTAYAWERHPGSDTYIKDRDGNHVTRDGWINHLDGNLIAAAPEMAATIIAQGEQIETLSSLLAGAEKAATDRSEQIKRLQAAIHKADKWGDILSDLIEDEFITEEDME